MGPVARYGIGCLLVAGLVCAVALVGTAATHSTSVLGPVFTPDGSAIVAVRREQRAWVFGIGAEMLTPPARVWITRDRVAFVRIDRGTRAETRMRTLPPSPLEGTWIRAYRGREYGDARAAFTWRPRALEWQVGATDDTPLQSRTWRIESAPGRAASSWREGRAAGTGDDAATLSKDDEVLAPPGSPCVVPPPQIVATTLSAEEVRARRAQGTRTPLFHITPTVFQVGLFTDVQAALDEPGVEVEYRGPYILHQQYAASPALNGFLAGGGNRYFVETLEGVAEIRLVPRRDVTR